LLATTIQAVKIVRLEERLVTLKHFHIDLT